MTSPAALALKVQNSKISRHLDPARNAASAADYPHHEENFGPNQGLKGTVVCLQAV
jgi:hypothetical protein